MGPYGDILSGKHTKNYGKSPFLMGKSPFSIAMFVYQRLWPNMG